MPSRHKKHTRLAGRMHLGLIVLLIFAVILGITAGGAAALLPRGDRITRGVTSYDLALGGLTKARASETLNSALAKSLAQQLTLTAGDGTRAVTLHDLGITPDTATIMNRAYGIGRNGALIQRVFAAARARWTGVTIAPTFTIDEKRSAAILTEFGGTINHVPSDATAHWDGNQVVITPERRGAKLDIPASIKLMKADILTGLATRQPVRAQLALPYREKYPRITAEKLASVDTVLGSFSTSYASSSRNRANNVETAANSIHGLVLLPGETFSFNETVGPRNVASGYRTAPVIVNGQLEDGLGGGICQTSTTLYNAVLLANLEIVTRNHHSLPSHYVATGLDATVSYGTLDFRFRNSTDAPIVIDTTAKNRRLQVRILGQGPAPEVRIVRSNIKTLPGRTITKKDPSLPKGTRVVEKKGGSGLAVTVTRVVGSGEGAIQEPISKDRYPGEPTIVRVGTGPAAPIADTQAPEAIPADGDSTPVNP